MLYAFLFVLVLLIIPFAYYTYHYRNPYKLIMVFGKKGSGKTTFLAKKRIRKNRRIKKNCEEVPQIRYTINHIDTPLIVIMYE